MCCIFSDDPLGADERQGGGHRSQGYRTFGNKMQTGMMYAPCSECPWSCCWFTGQFLPVTCGITQYMLRRKAIGYDMTKYRCFQGQFAICCIKGGACGEESCPSLCLCCEAHLCNGPAVSASRMLVMDRHDLMSDPCDNQLIRCNNCLQIISCVCDTLAMIDQSFRDLAHIIDLIAEITYHTISGCMTAQTAHEINYQDEQVRSGSNQHGQHTEQGHVVYAHAYKPEDFGSAEQSIGVPIGDKGGVNPYNGEAPYGQDPFAWEQKRRDYDMKRG